MIALMMCVGDMCASNNQVSVADLIRCGSQRADVVFGIGVSLSFYGYCSSNTRSSVYLFNIKNEKKK